MHRCLSIPEILRIIFEYLVTDVEGEGPPDASSVTRPLLTCKAFLEPALDILWESLDSLAPLARNFPSDAWEESVVNEVRNTSFHQHMQPTPASATYKIRFTRPITSDDLNRIQPYRRRVKSFTLTSSPSSACNIDCEALRVLTLACMVHLNEEPVLPCLRCLHVAWDDMDDTRSVHFFVSDKLKRVTVALPPFKAELGHLAILSVLGIRAPRLEYMHCAEADNTRDELIGSTISSMVCAMHNLRIVHFPNSALDTLALNHLASLPNLHAVELFAPPIQSISTSSVVLHAPFPVLRRPSLRAFGWDDLISFAEKILPEHLEEFNAMVDNLHSGIVTSQLRQLNVTLAAKCRTTLAKVALQDTDQTSWRPLDPAGLTALDMEPLLACEKLDTLSLEPRCSFGELGDRFLLALAKALPKLRHLGFPTYSRCVTLSKFTPIGMLYLAQHCPHLEWIGLPINEHLSDWVGKATGDTCASRVRYLTLGRSPLRSNTSKDMALFLSSVFPDLEKIVAWEGKAMDDPSAHNWKNVIELYDYGHTIRKQERA
ncbi:hypothetical protein FIBSPDRAFT_1053603 [Athelia psychrophila]|uniref:F-box domain-containing protein n=1 Tax=Athelia psychrophila TaxID=1759441 RepID=A0A167WPP3_9AGAM|nr:hypothetical protein FIBSPDRAFT_1053603 [Fibularhizoctonia sp. CBS 109695]